MFASEEFVRLLPASLFPIVITQILTLGFFIQITKIRIDYPKSKKSKLQNRPKKILQSGHFELVTIGDRFKILVTYI